MLTFAAQTVANVETIIIPDEPTTLSLFVLGAGTLAVYATLSGRWRRAVTQPARTAIDGKYKSSIALEEVRRAA